jgi:hypothetical protein
MLALLSLGMEPRQSIRAIPIPNSEAVTGSAATRRRSATTPSSSGIESPKGEGG